MTRILLIPALAVLLVIGVACGSSDGSAIETLPPIRTTSTIATTSTSIDTRRRFYEVKAGDNLAEIARRFAVPRGEIVKLNNLLNDGSLLQVGQILEIPTDIVLIDDLPTIPSSDP